MNFLRPTPDSCLKVLERLALHYPRSKQVTILDLLAEDYAKACKDMTQAEFKAAADKALETCEYFPTIAQVRKAVGVVRSEQRRDEIREYERQVEEHWTEEQSERAGRNAREILDAIRTGRKPHFAR